MRMRFSRLLFMSIKRTLMSPILVLLLFSLPVITLITGLYSRFSDDNMSENRIPVAYCIYDNDEDSDATSADKSDARFTPLSNPDPDSMYSFYECDSEAMLRDEILSGKAECGYLIPSDIFATLATGDTKKKVQVYISPASTQAYIVNETVYAEIFKELAPLLLRNYIYEYSEIKDQAAQLDGKEINGEVFSEDRIYELYDEFSTNGSTFSVVTDAADNDGTTDDTNSETEDSRNKNEVSAASLRGLLSVLIMLCGFCGVLKFFSLADNPVLSSFRVRLCTILSPLFLSVAVSEFCLILSALFGNKSAYALSSGNPLQKISFISGNGLISEILGLLLFMGFCVILLMLLSYVIPERSIFCAFMPVYLLSALIFTPVFIDIPSLMPVFRFVKFLFPSVWYI